MFHLKQLVRLGLVGLLAAAAVGCVEETPALFIVHNSALDDDCQPVIQTTVQEFVGRGTMDVTVATQYIMFPRVENLMSPSGSVSLGRSGGGGRGATTGYEGNRVTLSEAEVSFDAPEGFGVTLPRRIQVPISGTIDPEGAAVVVLKVIDEPLGEQLRASAQLQDRGSSVSIVADIRFRGQTTSGTEVESNAFSFPIQVCRGCLLEFPLEANDPLDTQPNCRADLTAEESEVTDSELTCLPGQDQPLDCRVCRILVTSQGRSEEEVEQACEPAPGN